jgi:hypothetical protein
MTYPGSLGRVFVHTQILLYLAIIIMTKYVVAVPTYNRADVVSHKTLTTLRDGGVPASVIHLFVANKAQEKLYKEFVAPTLYGKIVVGKIGIANQRKFICKYFPEGQYVVSIDDDVEAIEVLKHEKLVRMKDIHGFFTDAYDLLRQEGLYIWGVYPVRNPFFMHKGYSTDLKFVIGVLRGFINRHSTKLSPSTKSEGKEDYEQSILYYKMDGGVLRFNSITTKTKFNAKGGLGEERFEMNRLAAEYLQNTYPDLVTITHRKNGMTEIRLSRRPRL